MIVEDPEVAVTSAAGARAGAATDSGAAPVPFQRIPLHIAFGIDSLSDTGGTELNAVRSAELLLACGMRLTIIAQRPDGPMRVRYESAGARVVYRTAGGSLVGRRALMATWELAKFLRAESVDVVHCHDMYSNVFIGLAARLARRPGVITSKRWTVSPLRHRVLNGFAYRSSDRVVVNSCAVARSLADVEWVPRSRIVRVPNFLDDALFSAPSASEVRDLRARWGVPDAAQVVGCVARFRPEKNQASLVRAFASIAPTLPAARLVLVGDGECDAMLRELAAALGVGDRVHFPGSAANGARAHHGFDVSVLPSLNEGFPNTVLEGMAAGRAIVATDVGGVREAIRSAEQGWVVPVADDRALAEAILQVLVDPVRALQIGQAGRASVAGRFRASAVRETLTELYSAHRPNRPHSG